MKSSLLCLMRRHTGQKDGGTMGFTCPRCGRFRPHRVDFSATQARADRMIAQGRGDEAMEMVRQDVQRYA